MTPGKNWKGVPFPMDVWGILGIPPTEEIPVIKKAYAGQLKKHHPEDDPQGFQQLREAYEMALLIAKGFKNSSSFSGTPSASWFEIPAETTVPDNDQPPMTSRSADHTANGTGTIPLPPSPSMRPLETTVPELDNSPGRQARFLDQVAHLYEDFWARLELSNWKAVFNNDLLWNINNRNAVSQELLSFLADHHHLTQDVWWFLDEFFHWSEQKDSYNSQVPAHLHDYLTYLITSPRAPWYAVLKKVEGFDYEKFLNSREAALHSSLEQMPNEDSQYYIAHREEIYPDDPQLAAFLGRYYYTIKDYDQAKSYLEKAIQINIWDDSLPTLLDQVNRAIQSKLGDALIQKPWRKERIKQNFGSTSEIRALKRLNSNPAILQTGTVAMVIGCFILILFMLRLGVGSISNSPDNRVEIPVTPTQEMEDLLFMDINQMNIEEASPYQKVKARFERITLLQLTCTLDQKLNRIFVSNSSDSITDRLLKTKVAVGKINQQEIILMEEGPYSWRLADQSSLTTTGVTVAPVSPQMLNAVKQELTRLNAPAEIAANLVTTKYIVMDHE